MRYYELIPTSQSKRKGEFIKEYHLAGTINDQNYLGNYSKRQKITFLPLIPSIEIGRNHKIPDLFRAGGGISPRFVLSVRLKGILDKYRADKKIQFFPIELIRNNLYYRDFWVTNFYESDDRFIDFESSEFIEQIITSEGNRFIRLTFSTENIEKKYVNLKEFLDRADELYRSDHKLVANRTFVLESCTEDVMILDPCVSLYIIVSDRLKRAIEDNGILGLEFKPLDISDEKWYGPNGLRKQFYK